jgi:molecular chaperone DnaJ
MLLEDTGTHYAVLGISELASPEEVKKAFRRNARRCHPDIVGASDSDKLADAERRFKLLSHAYDVLIDPDARRQYDMFLNIHSRV